LGGEAALQDVDRERWESWVGRARDLLQPAPGELALPRLLR
jgi:hypothetical protein